MWKMIVATIISIPEGSTCIHQVAKKCKNHAFKSHPKRKERYPGRYIAINP